MTHLMLSESPSVISSDGRPRTIEDLALGVNNPSPAGTYEVWIEDIPAGADVYGTWTWDTTKKVSGTQSSTIGPGSGLQEYYFDQSPDHMVIDNATEAIVVYALLDPCNPPQQIIWTRSSTQADLPGQAKVRSRIPMARQRSDCRRSPPTRR